MNRGVVVAALLLACPAAATAAVPPPADPRPAAVGPARVLSAGLLTAYRGMLSEARGTVCPMEPSCSRYSSRVFSEHSPAVAFVMTADRLLRCGTDGGAEGRSVDPLPARGTPPTTEGGTGFASWLATNGEYERAITEYLREAYSRGGAPDDPAFVSACRCRYLLRDDAGAAACSEALLAAVTDPAGRGEVLLQLGAVRMRQGNQPAARRAFQAVLASPAPPGVGDLADRARMLEALAAAMGGDWGGAAHGFGGVSEGSPFRESARRCLSACERAAVQPRRDPKVAGLLAVIPGLGYLYAGYPRTALSAAIVNGTFVWGAVEAYRDDRPGLGSVLGVLGIGWYAGSVYGAVTSARRTNDATERELQAGLDVGFRF